MLLASSTDLAKRLPSPSYSKVMFTFGLVLVICFTLPSTRHSILIPSLLSSMSWPMAS